MYLYHLNLTCSIGSYNNIFAFYFDNGVEEIARIPTSLAGAPFFTTASEVATLEFVWEVLGICAHWDGALMLLQGWCTSWFRGPSAPLRVSQTLARDNDKSFSHYEVLVILCHLIPAILRLKDRILKSTIIFVVTNGVMAIGVRWQKFGARRWSMKTRSEAHWESTVDKPSFTTALLLTLAWNNRILHEMDSITLIHSSSIIARALIHRLAWLPNRRLYLKVSTSWTLMPLNLNLIVASLRLCWLRVRWLIGMKESHGHIGSQIDYLHVGWPLEVPRLLTLTNVVVISFIKNIYYYYTYI